eukprot:1306481-Rhodomonas_salina.1
MQQIAGFPMPQFLNQLQTGDGNMSLNCAELQKKPFRFPVLKDLCASVSVLHFHVGTPSDLCNTRNREGQELSGFEIA